MIQQAQLNN